MSEELLRKLGETVAEWRKDAAIVDRYDGKSAYIILAIAGEIEKLIDKAKADEAEP